MKFSIISRMDEKGLLYYDSELYRIDPRMNDLIYNRDRKDVNYIIVSEHGFAISSTFDISLVYNDAEIDISENGSNHNYDEM